MQTTALLEEGLAAAPDPPELPARRAVGPANVWTAVVECVGLKKHCITNLLLLFVVVVESYKLIDGETRERLLELAIRYVNVTVN
jgi:hypothetical protein